MKQIPTRFLCTITKIPRIPVKETEFIPCLKKLLDESVPVMAVGLQSHWNIGDPTEQNLRDAIYKFSSPGLQIQVTEPDVSIYTSRTDTINTGFTHEREQKQIDLYKMAFNFSREEKNVVTRVTFWNLSNRGSWLDNLTPRRGKHYPLLFGKNLKPKKVF